MHQWWGPRLKDECIPCAQELHEYHACFSVGLGSMRVDGHAPDGDSSKVALAIGLLENLGKLGLVMRSAE